MTEAKDGRTVDPNEPKGLDVRPGSVFDGFENTTGLGSLTWQLCDHVAATYAQLHPERSTPRTYKYSRLPWALLTPRWFNGRLINPRATILDTDISFLKGVEAVDPVSAVNFLAEAEMRSSTVGLMGTVQAEVLVYVRMRRNNPGIPAPYVMVAPRDARIHVNDRYLLSRLEAVNAERQALTRMVSGGLPGSGRKA